MDLTYYEGAHSVTFGYANLSDRTDGHNRNTWTDWHLIPLSKPVIAPPTVKTKQIDIPGANGILDLTTILTGYPLYNNRTGSLSFILCPGVSFENTKSAVMSYLHGQAMKLFLTDDPEYYWEGRFSVNELKSDAKLNSITINYDLYPYKRAMVASFDNWLWDPFNFETGMIRSWSNITIGSEDQTGTVVLEVNDCDEPIYPSVLYTGGTGLDVTHTFYSNGITTSETGTIEPGLQQLPWYIRPGANNFVFTGKGQLSFRYRGGRL